MSTRLFYIGITLFLLLLLYGVYATGEALLCYNAALHDPYVILTHGSESAWSYCVDLHILFPFSYF